MRKLDGQFMFDLREGILCEIRELLLRDSTLDFNIRDNQVHIYYRGGKIWDIKRQPKLKQYKASFDSNYCKGRTDWKVQIGEEVQIDLEAKTVILPSIIQSEADVKSWISSIPFIKQVMDEYFSEKPSVEREYQQHVVYENNNVRTAQGTDYFIVDIEYKHDSSRFDMLAILWPSKGHLRKVPKEYKPRLAFIEMKFGDNALSGGAGIEKHLKDVDAFLGNEGKFERIRDEVQSILQQKRELELLQSLTENSNSIQEISDEKPQFILLLAAHDPESQKLLNELEQISPPEHCDLKFAVANFMGYGLYQEAIYGLEDFRERFSKQLFSKE